VHVVLYGVVALIITRRVHAGTSCPNGACASTQGAVVWAGPQEPDEVAWMMSLNFLAASVEFVRIAPSG
jgi:hypothetical protein